MLELHFSVARYGRLRLPFRGITGYLDGLVSVYEHPIIAGGRVWMAYSSRRGQLNNGVPHTSKCLSMLTVKALLIILYPSLHSLSQDNAMDSERKKCLDAVQKSKNHANRSLMGPLKSWETPGKYPLFTPSQWACSQPSAPQLSASQLTGLDRRELVSSREKAQP